jgi:putative NIF3 family GTP cyclohydrolase 1 type 2
MKVREVNEHFLNRAAWVDRTKTVDRVIIGDPEKDVDHCVVLWIPSFAALRTVARMGVGLVVCHEPTFWGHWDDAQTDRVRCTEKVDFINEHGIAIVRNHDVWDRFPQCGIPWAWAKFLGLPKEPAAVDESRYQHRYDIEPVPLGEFAHRIAARTAAIGQPMVEVTGDLDRPVSKIGIGTGCGTSLTSYLDIGCDCCIMCDDGNNYWAGGQLADDLGVPTIWVNHGTSEEPGMVSMTRYINDHLEGLTAEHLPQGCRFRLVGA